MEKNREASYPSELVIKVNEVFHDVEESDYDEKHPEIFKQEGERWQRVFKDILVQRTQAPVTLLDIGVGTGFVPVQIAHLFKEHDKLICSDLSAKMLDVCKKNTEQIEADVTFEYLKLDGKTIDIESSLCKFVTMNSVVHHVPELASFFTEIDRVLKPHGYIVIGHEPNKLFHENGLLWWNYRFLSIIIRTDRWKSNIKKAIKSILRKFGIIPLRGGNNEQTKPESQNHQNREINRRLLQKKEITDPLSDKQIAEIVDIHSPTAGGFHKDRGIIVEEIIKQYLPGYSIHTFETYNHLCKISSRNGFTIWLCSVLKKMYPKQGSTFFTVLKKP
ncbi:MAG: class I SAM-dependent methyltransferase [bacterium]